MKTDELTERVLWLNPEAVDNVGVEQMSATHQSGSEFTQGVTMVNYTATDQAGNRAYCNFSVHVYQG